jgi:pimeloyl-ACP methyl ester carboxylesterase
MQSLKHIPADPLNIAYLDSGPANGRPVFLMHGFPYDIHAYAEVAPILAAQGCRVIVPYLRGFGPTRFLKCTTPRSGEQAALGADLLALLNALAVPRAVLAGYDWGGRAACIVAALWPERVRGLVSANGYNIQDIAGSAKPAPAEQEYRLWYQYYFHTERGRAGLQANRREFCRLLWRLWSPNWEFDDATYDRTAASFDNPDFVDVVIHSYRHRYGYADGDAGLEPIEWRLAAQPRISVPTIVLHGDGSGISPPESSLRHAASFSGPYQRRVIPIAGHNLPQEAPNAVADAVLELIRATK